MSLLAVPFWTPAALQVVLLRGVSPESLAEAELCPVQASQPSQLQGNVYLPAGILFIAFSLSPSLPKAFLQHSALF